MVKRILELFCGTKSVGTIFKEKGYEVVSLDYNKKFDATHTVDVLTWDYKIYSCDHFDVIWASPDCTTWSLASGGKYRKKDNIYGLNNEFQEKADVGNNMVLRVIEILKYFKCKSWFIENPRGLMQHFPPFMDFIKETNSNKVLVYYANYNDWGFPKPTHIWSNLKLWENETMPVMSEDKYVVRFKTANNANKKFYKAFTCGTPESRSKIPPDLIERLYNLIL
jgi:site-specific DNA-cytosine methylase